MDFEMIVRKQDEINEELKEKMKKRKRNKIGDRKEIRGIKERSSNIKRKK